MLIRIVTAGVASLLFLITAVGGAAAQTAAAASGQPISLLQLLTQPAAVPAKPRIRSAGRYFARTHAAPARIKMHPANVAKVAAPEAADDADGAAAAPAAAASFALPQPSELIIAGRSVQIVSPNDANDIDLAADAQNAPPPTPAPDDVAAAPAPATALVARTPPDESPISNASWIAQAFAALAGAIAAGSVAWFLIGPVPQRTYG